MHRTEGDSNDPNKNGTGKRGYRSATPASIAATALPAEAMNAIQEEICLVIENAGLTLNASASADRTAVWGQLYEAIFQANHGTTDMLAINAVNGDRITDATIADAKIIDLDFSKVSGEMTQSQSGGGLTETMTITFDQLLLRADSVSGNVSEHIFHQTNGFSGIKEQSNGNDYEFALNAYGLSFWGGPKFTEREVAFTSANFTDSLDRSIAYVDTGVKITEWDPVDASISYEDSAVPGIGSYSAPNRYSLAMKFGPTRFTAPVSSTTWIAVLVFLDDAFYTDADTTFLDKKAQFKFRRV
jgi:hypothetical protein